MSPDEVELDFNPSHCADPSQYLCIVITHAFGYPFKVDKIVAWANKHGIPVLEVSPKST